MEAAVPYRTRKESYKRIGAVAMWEGYYDKGQVRMRLVEYWEGLNFRFNFRIFSDREEGYAGRGEVSVLGLSVDTIRKYASRMSPYENLKKSLFITVYAGYDDGRPIWAHELFSMQYIGSEVSSPPEMWLKFIGQDSNAAFSLVPLTNKGLKNPYRSRPTLTVKEACEYLCQRVERKLVWKVPQEIEDKLPEIVSGGLPLVMNDKEAVEYINSLNLVRAYRIPQLVERVSNPPTVWASGAGVTTMLVKELAIVIHPMPSQEERNSTGKQKEKRFVISEDNGMVGQPRFELVNRYNTLNVKTLMRTDIEWGDYIHPVSRYVLNVPAKWYRVVEVTYEGELRGTPWYVNYRGVGMMDSEM